MNRSALFIHGANSAIAVGLRRAGYQLEFRRNGELRVGLWRKALNGKAALRERASNKRFPKRLVLIPGWGDTPLGWMGVLATLAPRLRRCGFDEVVLFDFPGYHGFLFRDRGFHDLGQMSGAVQDILDALKPETIIGHSLGGFLGAQYAAACGVGARPARNNLGYKGPENLIVVSPAGVFGGNDLRQTWENEIHEMLVNDFERFRSILFRKEPFWFRWIANSVRDFIAREDVGQFLNSFKKAEYDSSLLTRIRSRVFVLWGEHDTFVPTAFLESWVAGLEQARSVQGVLIKDVGHNPHMEKPRAMIAVLRRIFASEGMTLPADDRWKLVSPAPRVASNV